MYPSLYAWYTHVIVEGMMKQGDPLKELHEALLQIVSVLNRPQGDNMILNRAGVSLDTALFPLLVRVSMQRNLTIGALADQVGRDYSTVSRQVTRLQALGLVHPELSETDRRQRLLSVTAAGRNTIKKIDRARKSVMSEALDGWSQAEIAELARMTTRLAAAMQPRT
jgi:DNA-binding MarR family transcriptional regulator